MHQLRNELLQREEARGREPPPVAVVLRGCTESEYKFPPYEIGIVGGRFVRTTWHV